MVERFTETVRTRILSLTSCLEVLLNDFSKFFDIRIRQIEMALLVPLISSIGYRILADQFVEVRIIVPVVYFGCKYCTHDCGTMLKHDRKMLCPMFPFRLISWNIHLNIPLECSQASGGSHTQ